MDKVRGQQSEVAPLAASAARGRSRWLALVAVVLVAGASLLACSPGKSDDAGTAAGQAGGEQGSVEQGGADEPDEVDLHAAFVAEFTGELDEHFAAAAVPADLGQRLETRLEQAIEVARKRTEAKSDRERPERDLWYDGTLDDFYQTRAYEPAFTRSGHLTAGSRALFEQLADAERHGLDPADYHVDSLEPLLEKSVALSEQMNARLAAVTEAERQALGAALAERGLALDTEEQRKDALAWILRGEGGAPPVPRLAEAFTAYQADEAELAELAVELEILLADAYLRYARDMRHANINAVTDDEAARLGGRPLALEHHTPLILARLRAQLDRWAALDAADAEAARAHVEALWPPSEQYRKLLDARARYAKLAAEGGWEEVTPKALRQGTDSPTVAAVKRRLAAEGFYDGPLDPTYDAAFTEAVRQYQETHQLEVTGESDKAFWRSLNIPVERRLEEIEVNLRRWRRDSHVVDSDYFVYINVPDFHAEVWRDGTRDMRFRIVTGNTEKTCDPKTQTWTYANATPLQHAKLEYLVLNPYWHVPPRIEKEEYVDKIAADPQWLEDHGFEYYTDPGGYTVLRQLPGESNALGKVKFIFPNVHSTFMHDTAQKQYFKYPVRAFSHGCMRVQDPMNLAEYLLRNDGKWEMAQPYVESLNQEQINLGRTLDVFIDYHTVRVDEQARVHFLADIYKYVRDEIDPPPAYAKRCEPEPQITLAEARAKLNAPADDVVAPALPPALLEDAGALDGGTLPGLTTGGGSSGTPSGDGAPIPPSRAPAVPTVDD